MNRNKNHNLNRQRNSRKNPNLKHDKVKVIRCGLRQRPVFEHELCQRYLIKQSVSVPVQDKTCKSCQYSF